MQRTLGIDLGTTNSVMSYIHKGEPRIVNNRLDQSLTPSVVALGKSGELLVGEKAKGRLGLGKPDVIRSIKRLVGRNYSDPDVQCAISRIGYDAVEGPDGSVRVRMGDYEHSPIEISSLILRQLKEDAEDRLHERFGRAVITVPAYFGERQVAATYEAGRMAGFQVLRIINEPTAAALAWKLDREQSDDMRTIMVYDLGGGTFDISILLLMPGAVTVLGLEGNNWLGGDDFDSKITDYILRRIRSEYGLDIEREPATEKRIIRSTVLTESEKAKISLSSEYTADIIIPSLGQTGIPVELELSREEFEAMIRSDIQGSIQLTHKAIHDAHLTIDNIDSVILVGGSTMIPLVQSAITEVFGEGRVRKDLSPMQCVALGAAVQSTIIAETECPKCHAQNSVKEDSCPKCGTSLCGVPKVKCPVCFALCDAESTECHKCGNPLDGARQRAPMATNTESAAGEGGQKCPECGALNVQGATECQQCHTPLGVNYVSDIIPKDIGIELADGHHSTIVPRHTTCPCSSPWIEYYTAVPNQRVIDIMVYEIPPTDPQQIGAEQHELLGILTTPLESSLPKGTLVEVRIELNRDRIITVHLRVPMARIDDLRVQFSRNRPKPDVALKIKEQHEKLTSFVSKWTEELTAAERQVVQTETQSLDEALNDSSNYTQEAIDTLAKEAAELIQMATRIRGSYAWLTCVRYAGSNYLTQEEEDELSEIQQDMEYARERANWQRAEALSKKADEAMERLGGNVHFLVHSRVLAETGSLSPALGNRVQAALHTVDSAVHDSDKEKFRRGMDKIVELWDDVKQELDDQHIDLGIVTKPTDRRN